ncbi:MAG: hypothetical protein JWM25_1097 [Thermoleophilia bacterium]|nr:hypothetical protein [Thermoleophilia bacterium]MCZ4496514.1 hypothetical protein [Thermoleophilia bacterium]
MTGVMGRRAGVIDRVVGRVPIVRVLGGAEGVRDSLRALGGGPAAAGGTAPFAADLMRSLPHVPRLLYGVVRDGSVPLRYRAALLSVAVLTVSPIDVIPDFLPVIGALDDVALILLAIRWALRNIPEESLRANWHGADDSYDALLRLGGRLPTVDATVQGSE